jgi:hypothetical protein
MPVTTRPASSSGSSVSSGSSATATTRSSSATTTVICAGARLVDIKCPAHEFLPVEFGDSGLSRRFCRHFDKPKASRLTAELLLDNISRCNFPEGFKKFFQILICSLSRQISYKDVHFDFLVFERLCQLSLTASQKAILSA